MTSGLFTDKELRKAIDNAPRFNVQRYFDDIEKMECMQIIWCSYCYSVRVERKKEICYDCVEEINTNDMYSENSGPIVMPKLKSDRVMFTRDEVRDAVM